MRKLHLEDRTITERSLPYIIAEIGVNHEGSLDKAMELIKLAKDGGASAAKFQSYKAGTLASKNSPSYWDLSQESTTSQYELFKKYDSFGEREYEKLYAYCRELNIDFLSTPFDDDSLRFLTPLMKLIKIASADLTNIPFLRKVAKTKKPVVLSTGASTVSEICLALEELQKNGTEEISLLHCVLNYPTMDENANLGMIDHLMRLFPDLIIGYSDHTLPDSEMMVLSTSYIKGARIIEKHFTHDKSLPGNDHYHAMDVHDLKRFNQQVERVLKIEGSYYKKPLNSEEISRKNARRSIVLTQDIKEGEVFSDLNLTYKRPGTGISPIYWDEVIGTRASSDLREDHILSWKDIR